MASSVPSVVGTFTILWGKDSLVKTEWWVGGQENFGSACRIDLSLAGEVTVCLPL